jgi:hypothetical protein
MSQGGTDEASADTAITDLQTDVATLTATIGYHNCKKTLTSSELVVFPRGQVDVLIHPWSSSAPSGAQACVVRFRLVDAYHGTPATVRTRWCRMICCNTHSTTRGNSEYHRGHYVPNLDVVTGAWTGIQRHRRLPKQPNLPLRV